MARTSIAFVDDHPILLEGLARLFSVSGDYQFVGMGKNAADAISIVSQSRPELLIMDLNMAGNAFEAIARIREISPLTKVVAFTASAVVEHALRAIEAGATGYVLKGCTADELREAIGRVMEGETFITPSFAVKVIASLRNDTARESRPAAAQLSIRESQIVKLLLQGCTNKEIARTLQISEKTVKHYMTLLMQKMHARNRLGVVIAAQKLVENAHIANFAGRRPEMLS